MTESAKEIVKMITGMAGQYSPYEIFSDWVRCCALVIANSVDPFHGKIWEDRERQYKETMRRYREPDQITFSNMLVLLADSLEKEMTDTLGEIFMDKGMGSSSQAGQFFTPFNLSELAARMMFADSIPSNPEEMTELNEPSCGSGGMIIAMAKVMKDHGINYQTRMKVVAQDIDWRCVYMCYTQISLLGINGIVVQGDTLGKPYSRKTEIDHILLTPKAMGALL